MENKVEYLRLLIEKKEAEAALLDMSISDLRKKEAEAMRLDMLKRDETAAIAGISTLTGVDQKYIRRIFEVGDSEGYLTHSAIQHIAKVSVHKANAILKDMEHRGMLTGAVVTDVPNGHIYISLEDRSTSLDRISAVASRPAPCEDCEDDDTICETTPDKCELLNPKGGDISEAGDTASSGRDLIDVIDRDA